MKKIVEIKHTVEIEVDESKFTEKFMEEYRQYICQLYTVEEHMENLVSYYCYPNFPYEFDKSEFVEGYGKLYDLGVKFVLLNTETDIYD